MILYRIRNVDASCPRHCGWHVVAPQKFIAMCFIGSSPINRQDLQESVLRLGMPQNGMESMGNMIIKHQIYSKSVDALFSDKPTWNSSLVFNRSVKFFRPCVSAVHQICDSENIMKLFDQEAKTV